MSVCKPPLSNNLLKVAALVAGLAGLIESGESIGRDETLGVPGILFGEFKRGEEREDGRGEPLGEFLGDGRGEMGFREFMTRILDNSGMSKATKTPIY